MTSFILSSGAYTERSLAEGEQGMIGVNAVIEADTAAGITGTGAFGGGVVTAHVYGSILATFQASIAVSDTALRLFVGSTGNLTASTTGSVSYSCVTIEGATSDSTIQNLGTIHARSFGIYHDGSGDFADLDVYNAGSIFGRGAAIRMVDGGTFKLNNSGVIIGEISGIDSTTTGGVAIVNAGEIRGGEEAVATYSGSDSLINSGELWGDVLTSTGNDDLDNRGGLIMGDVDLGAGNDKLDNLTGEINGAINLGLGNDFFRAGSGIETVEGGGGVDALDFRGGAAVALALDGSISAMGRAAEDVYTNFRNIFGSAYGDQFVGDTQANTLRGYGGVDTLAGGLGADRLVGGVGFDHLTGGAGNDVFVFDSLSEAGDVITDFSGTGTNNDLFNIRALVFGGGLVAGALTAAAFQSRADNQAQDLNDRFIFRTTDQTLWFDADGSNAGAAVMLADLQASAVVTFADIILV